MHSTHKTRFSDSSLYDEKCVNCGATDAMFDRERSERPCPDQIAGRARQYVDDEIIKKVLESE